MLDVNSFNAALGRFLLRSGHGLRKWYWNDKNKLMMNHPGVFVAPKIRNCTFRLIIDILSVDDKGRKCRRKDIKITDLDDSPWHQCWHDVISDVQALSA